MNKLPILTADLVQKMFQQEGIERNATNGGMCETLGYGIAITTQKDNKDILPESNKVKGFKESLALLCIKSKLRNRFSQKETSPNAF